MSDETSEIVTNITRKAFIRYTKIILSFMTGFLSTLVIFLSSYHAIHQWSLKVSEIPAKEERLTHISDEIGKIISGVDMLLEDHDCHLIEVASIKKKLLAKESVVYYNQIFTK